MELRRLSEVEHMDVLPSVIRATYNGGFRVEAWAEIHREELQRDWDLLQSGRPPVKIEPLQ